MKLSDSIAVIKCFGLGAISKGLWHKLIMKLGLLEHKFPMLKWDQFELSSYMAFDVDTYNIKDALQKTHFFSVKEVMENKELLNSLNINSGETIRTAEGVSDCIFRYFSKDSLKLNAPDKWHRNPLNNAVWPKRHWSKLNLFSKELNDVKQVWEPNRFSWTYDLVRAYGLTGDSKYAATFWRLFEEWLGDNQPNYGVNWVSGQECSLRIMAWCFAIFAFLDDEATTCERLEKMILAISVHAERIEGFISHAIRQKTNHAMTEATGLYTVGVLFPFLKKACKWKNLGKKVLEQEGLKQIYEDGSYVQQSMNYHRVMLQAYLWSFRLAQLNNEEFSADLVDRVSRASDFAYQLQDNKSGRVPNYGANDGALILPLNSCDYLDYRPILQSMNYLLHQKRVFGHGPWDEDLLWLFGPKALDGEKEDENRVSSEFATGGYYTLRQENSWGMIRCHTYKDRVGHIDMLHFDLWADGVNLLRDCGSYKYFAPDEPEMENYFKSIWAHNTVVVDDASPLKTISRFMWLPWPKAKMRDFYEKEGTTVFKGCSFAYDRLPWNVVHSREVISCCNENKWQVTDTLEGDGQHKVNLRWHLPLESEIVKVMDKSVLVRLVNNWFLKVVSEDRFIVELLSKTSKGGWESLYYSQKNAINTLSVISVFQLPVTFVTDIYKQG